MIIDKILVPGVTKCWNTCLGAAWETRSSFETRGWALSFCSLERQVQACEGSAPAHNSLVGQALMQGKVGPHPTGQMPMWRVQS